MPVNPVEILKAEKDGLDVLADIHRYAREGFHSIDPGDFDRFKWYGLYQQRPKEGHFMLRVKIHGGRYNSKQLRELGEITNRYARGVADITTRQSFQMHWLTIEDIPDIFARMDAVGLTSIGACGDITRNITGCPLAGRDPGEVFDAMPEVMAVMQRFLGNREYSNLPRKYKINITGCGVNCTFPQINCAAFVGVPHGPNGDNEEGYDLYIGGGLSILPHVAKSVDIFLKREQVVEAAEAVTQIFRDHGGRAARTRARLKFLMDEWGPEKFREEIQNRVSFPLMRASGLGLREAHHDHLGVHSQKQPGLSYVGVTVPTGRLTGDQMLAIAELADRLGGGELANTVSQNFVVLDIPNANLDRIVEEIIALGLDVRELSATGNCVTCTGNEFCNLAVTETKAKVAEIANYLEEEVPWDTRIRISINGCPNSCGQHHIADIGLQGVSTKIDGKTVECYDFHVGGGLGNDPSFVRKVARRIGENEIKLAVGNIIKQYQARRSPGQSFRAWCSEFSEIQIAEMLGVGDVKLKETAGVAE